MTECFESENQVHRDPVLRRLPGLHREPAVPGRLLRHHRPQEQPQGAERHRDGRDHLGHVLDEVAGRVGECHHGHW